MNSRKTKEKEQPVNRRKKVPVAPASSFSIRERAKKVPLSTRLFVEFQMQWLRYNVEPNRCHTAAEARKATAYARKMTKAVMKVVREWKNDGAGMDYRKPKKK